MTSRERLIDLRATVGALHRADEARRTTEHWSTGRRRLREAVLADDPAQLLTWDVIRDTMLVATDRHPYLTAELETMQADPDWSTRWQPATDEDGVGAPPPMPGLPGGSGNRLHHAYQFRLLEQATGAGVETYDAVVEFGAGYGAMCAVAHRLGFTGSYLLHDLPEWSALQRWYLGEIGLSAAHSSSEDELVDAVKAAGDNSLFVAMWSLSETPLALREAVMVGDPRGYLFGYQPRFEGIDNLAWFQAFREARPDLEWSGGEPEELSGNRYLFGRRR